MNLHLLTIRASVITPAALALALTAACTDDGAGDDQDNTSDSESDSDSSDSDSSGSDSSGSDSSGSDSSGSDSSETGEAPLSVNLTFAAAVGDAAAACGQSYEGVGSEGTTVEIQDFRFYVHGVELLDAEGNGTPVALEQDGLWQVEDLALLDFEDGTGACQDAGTTERNDTVVGTVPAGDYSGVRFVLGVPFELNHQAVDAAPSPLNLPSMFWAWQGGYKFARVDLRNGNPDDDAWFWHLGSTGCESAGPDQPPTQECARPNRVLVEFADFDAAGDTIVLDIGMMLEGVDVSQNTAMTAPGCMSATTDPECVALFPKLGLDLDSGSCASDCSDQKVFRVE